MKKTSEKNKRFWELPAGQKRVKIAKDVLKQIKLGFLKAESGTYFIINATKDLEVVPEKFDELIKKVRRTGATCDACGIGSIFLGLVNMGDKITSDDVGVDNVSEDEYCSVDDWKMRRKLRTVFSSNQLSLIECAFEKSSGFHDSHRSNTDMDDREVAAEFGRKYDDDEERLVAIMKNIIVNKGTFKP